MNAALFDGICDDAAVFPPGNMPLTDAIWAHHRHKESPYADLVGSFVLAATDLADLMPLVAELPAASLPLSLTAPWQEAAAAVDVVATLPAVRLTGVEVTLDGADPGDAVRLLDDTLAAQQAPIFVEVPRDQRRGPCIDALATSRCLAKLRTGGVHADLHPDEKELAEAVVTLTRSGVAFKATAGLHHAVRNTDARTRFEQHGFLNLLTAVAAAREGADVDTLVGLLAERDPARVLDGVRRLDPAVRDTFRSFGTCSIIEPVEELVVLGVLPTDLLTRGR